MKHPVVGDHPGATIQIEQYREGGSIHPMRNLVCSTKVVTTWADVKYLPCVTPVAPTFVTSTTFVTAHHFCQFISTAFVNLTTFVNFCQLRTHQFCQHYQTLMSLQTRSLLLSQGLITFVNRNLSTSSMLSHNLK